jgi:signal transduction histidine kinase
MMPLSKEGLLLDPPPGTAAARLLERRERILHTWLDRVKRAIPNAAKEGEPILIDTFPAFLERLAEALAPGFPREVATEGNTIASEHGGERARLTGITPAELLREYQLLRDVLFEVLEEDTPLTAAEARTVILSVDQALSESLTAYFLVHEGLREQLTNTLTHDLRAPLSAVRASAELILRHPGRPDRVPVLAGRVVETVKRMERMVEDLLDTSRIRFGERIHYTVTEWELRELLEEVVGDLATVHGSRFRLEGPEVRGFWNREAFRRAVENLLVNAVKYGDPGAPVTIRLETCNGRVILSVHNQGPSIRAEEQERLFQPFVRSDSVARGRSRGWGLGLPMARAMAEGHGGSISVDSAPERGTTFVIDIPVDARPYLGRPTTPAD